MTVTSVVGDLQVQCPAARFVGAGANRSMMFRDPEGNLINVFSRPVRQQ